MIRSHARPLGGYIEERTERLGEDVATVYSVTNDAGFVPSLDRFDKRVFSAEIKNYKRVSLNDLAYNPSRINVGSVAICQDAAGGAVSPMYCVLRCKEGLLPRYLFHFLRSEEGLFQIKQRGEGSVRVQLKYGDLCLLTLPIPAVHRQEELIKVLEEANALRALRVAADNRTATLAPSVFNKMFGDPAKNQRRWNMARLLDVCEFQGGTQPPKNTFLYEPTTGYIRLIQIRDFENDRKPTYVPAKLRLKTCTEGDVMIARYGASLGRILRGKAGAYNVALVKTIPDESVVTRDFLYYWLSSSHFQGHLATVGDRAAQAGFNKEDLAQLEIYLPPLSLQHAFARRIGEIQELERAQRVSSSRLDAAFESVLHRAFASEL